MNRIVIIGNGFDLAQGLKTGYEDFLLDFLKEEFQKGFKNYSYNGNTLFNFKTKLRSPNYYEVRIHPKNTLADLFDEIPFENKPYSHSVNNYLEVNIKSSLFKKMLLNKNWTDIEKVYFNCLIEIVEKADKLKFQEQILKLNADFEYLKSKLVEYLKKIETSAQHKNSLIPFLDLLKRQLQKPDFEYLKRFFKVKNEDLMKIELSQTYFLNFNYTKSLDFFINSFSPEAIHIQIHGNIDEPESIIFGYGDDASNSKYKELEDADIHELLVNFKSIHYPKTKNYSDLMNIIETEEPYDVIVLGHSMGISDRVLLESIFERDNCKAIRLFHRGSVQSFEDKVIAISRHFKNKQSMRSKIVYNPHDVLGTLKD
jgi:hypothetical protein